MQAVAKKSEQEAEKERGWIRGVVGQWITLVLLAVRNWFVSWTFFLPSFIVSLIGMVTGGAIFYLMGQVVAKGAQPHIAEYGLSYGSYIITGVMFTMIMDATLSAYHEAFLRGYWTNQFDVYLSHPGGVSALLTGEVLAKYLVASVNTIIYFLVAVWLFGVSVELSNLFDTFIILVLAVASLTGPGLAGASTFSLFNAKKEEANPVQLLATFGSTLLSGIYFPPSVLPGWLQAVGQWLPQTHILHAARLCLSGKASLGDPVIAGDISYLIKFSLVTLPIGVLLFAAGIRASQKEGSLTRWT